MFVSLKGDPFKSQLDALSADALGIGDLPVGMKIGGSGQQQLGSRTPSWNPSSFSAAHGRSAGPPLGVV
jgi:hypothetical protein